MNINFGGACNKHCEYCLQVNESNNKKADPELFIERFSSFCRINEISSIEVCNYWGGEPLLYMDSIKRVYHGIDSLFKSIKKHRITTNGTLIDDDYVDFCNNNEKIITVVSLHDCSISDDQWKKIGNINNLCLSGLFHKKNKSPLCYMEEWYRIKNLTKRELPIGIYEIKATDGCDSSFWIDDNDVDSFFRDIEFIVQPLANAGEGYCRSVMANFCYEMSRTHEELTDFSKCFGNNILSLDLFGNRYICHHNETPENKIANIFDKTIFVINKNPSIYFKSKECQSCEAIDVCKGGCFSTNTHDVECYFMKKKFAYYQKIKRNIR